MIKKKYFLFSRIIHHEPDHRITITIKRWPKVEEKIEKSRSRLELKSKTFIEEYIRQKHTTF